MILYDLLSLEKGIRDGYNMYIYIYTLPFTVYIEIGIGFLLIILHDLLENGIFSTKNPHIEALRKAPCVGFATEVS